jgi:MFS transporter, MHS family, citrate/tricarballylate:H+ symporter
MAGEFANNAIGVVAVLIGGIVSDRRGRRHVMLVSQALLCALVVPCFLWLTNERDGISFIGANLILSFASTYMYGAVYAAISESLPKAVRARVFALVYALPVALLGGSTQLVITWILHVTGSPMAIAWYLTGVSLIGLAAMLAIRESAPVKLRPDTLAELPYAAQPA